MQSLAVQFEEIKTLVEEISEVLQIFKFDLEDEEYNQIQKNLLKISEFSNQTGDSEMIQTIKSQIISISQKLKNDFEAAVATENQSSVIDFFKLVLAKSLKV